MFELRAMLASENKLACSRQLWIPRRSGIAVWSATRFVAWSRARVSCAELLRQRWLSDSNAAASPRSVGHDQACASPRGHRQRRHSGRHPTVSFGAIHAAIVQCHRGEARWSGRVACGKVERWADLDVWLLPKKGDITWLSHWRGSGRFVNVWTSFSFSQKARGRHSE